MRAVDVSGLEFELMMEDVAWSHTALSVELVAEDEQVQSELRGAIEPLIREALLNPNR